MRRLAKRSADFLSPDGGNAGIDPPETVSLRDRNAVKKATETLLRALDGETTGSAILGELAPLLFSGGAPGGEQAMKEAAREAILQARRDGACHG